MDQSHGHGIGAWDPSSFPGEAWDHQFSAFDQGTGAESSYPNPDFLDGGAINPQLSGADNQSGLYRPFDYYGQGDVWSDHPQTTAAPFAQDNSLPQAYFGEQRHPADANQTIDSRFALDIQQSNEFPSQLHGNANQQVNPHHNFNHGVTSPPGPAPNSYHQGPIPQWQEQVPTGYGSGPQFENPLSAVQSSNISAPVSNSSPSPFFSGQGVSAPAVSGYQTEARQQTPVNTRQVHPQFAASLNGQSQQPIPAQPPTRKATPQQLPQQLHQQIPQQGMPQQQPVQQPAQRPIQQSVQQQSTQQPVQQQGVQHQAIQQPIQKPAQQPVQRPTLHPSVQSGPPGQHVFPQQPLSQPRPAQQPQPQIPEGNSAAGVKRGATGETQVGPVVAKKVKVSAPPTANPSPPSFQDQVQNVPGPVCSIKHQDASLLAAARGRPGARWVGVPNLVVDSAPVKLQKGTPTKRYVTLSTKGGKDPLFTKMWRAWTPAESLGNHANTYQKATDDLDRQRADIRLDIEMKRGKTEIPVDWFKKGLKDRLGKEPQRVDPPAEPLYSGLKAVEFLRFHPAHLRNQKVAGDACSEFAAFLQSKAANLKSALQAAAEKPKGGQAEPKARTAKEQLERAVEEGLRVEPGNLFAKLSGSNKMVAILNNVLVRLINAGEANSSLAKVILRLYTRLTKVTSDQLEMLQMDKLRKKLGKEGDDEAKALISQVYDNARQNDDDGSESESDSPSAESGARGKKAVPTQARVFSKQTAPGSDPKKTASSSTSKPATSTTDSRKLSSAPPSKTMVPGSDLNKAAPKAPQKVLSGIKRAREDDPAGADARSSKKPTPDTSATGVKANSSAAKSLAVPAGKTANTKPTTASTVSGPAAAQTKPRSALLLPGKARPAAKPVSKAEPAKAESTLKAPTAVGVAKLTKPKPAEATKQAPASKSIFSSLMKEIVEEKKIKTPIADKKKVNAPDPNETPQERERRLHKERRRSLRVAFKSGDALVEIREFTRHPEEIESGMARNVRTDGRDKNSEESQMMKRLRGGQGIKALEVNDREWEEPTAINFAATIPQEKREKAYVTRGGRKTFETDEQKLTRERESKELMVIYHNRADIPPTPRSPPYEPSLSGSSAVHETHLSPETPEYDEMMQRGREYKQWGPYHASRAAQARLDTKARPDYADFTKTLKSINSIADSYNGQAPRQPEVHPRQPVAQTVVKDPRTWYEPTVAARRDQQTLELLSSDGAKNWQDPDPYNRSMPRKLMEEELDNDPKLRKALDNLQAIAASLKANQAEKSAQITPSPQPTQQEAPQPVTTTAPGAQAAAPDYSAAWAQYYAAQQQQQQQQQGWYGQQQNPYTQAAEPYSQAQVAQTAQQQSADPSNQYASILAALGVQQPAAQPQPQSAADQNNQIQAALMALAAGNQAQAAVPASADPQNTQYLLDMVKMATAQNQGQAQAQSAQNAYQQYYAQAAQAAQGYGQSYNQPNQDREAYGQAYGGSGAGASAGAGGQDRDWERERDGYGRDRDRGDRDRDYQRGGGGGGKGRGASGGGGKNDNIPEHLRGINRSLIGTKACAFWAKGQCAKGDKCTFRHD